MKIPHRFSLLLLLTISLISEGQSQNRDFNLYEQQLFIQGTDTLPCRILSPINFSINTKYPLVVFLHGSGERGIDNEAQLTWGGSLFLDSANRVNYPAIIVFPQCHTDSSWSVVSRKPVADSLGNFFFPMDKPATKPLQMVMDFIDTLVTSGRVDPKRIYIGGLSMGGFGTYEILWRRPKLFAAAIAICGGGNPESVKIYGKKFPIWVFHGTLDPSVPVANSRLMVNALQGEGAMVKYTEYPDVYHNSWTNAFAEPELLKWLFSQKKK
ncbi:MAG: phospholipase [Bacteroidetes bacterium]|nr:MAG: phospholipase [Bacteroidota bacterium]